MRSVVYLLFIIFGLFASYGLSRNLYTAYENSQYLEEARIKLDELKEENKELLEQIDEAETTSFIERAARENLGLVKPGEVVVILPDEEDVATGSASLNGNLPRPIWQQWLGLFFGL